MDAATDARFVRSFGEPPRSLRVQANGVELHLLEWGDASAQPVLMVHGMRGHARWFTPVGPAVGARYRALSLDLRGHGESGHVGPYGPMTFSDDVAALVDTMGLEHPILVGHSMGGSVTTRAAGLLGERIAGLVVVDSGFGPPPERAGNPGAPGPDARAWSRERETEAPRERRIFEDWPSARARFELRPGGTIASAEMLDHLAFHALEPLDAGRYRWRFAPDMRHRGPGPGARPGVRPPMPSTPFPELRVPVAAIFGGQSPIRGRTDLANYKDRFAGATWTAVEEIEHVHHHVFVDDAAAFNPVLMKYLDRMATEAVPTRRETSPAPARACTSAP
ncbi:MAG: alpha/beta hydrolase [Myxococcales bacterium]|nr:alpha/beta hydrolase [Myxococcales bacterium]